ncbi:hypothetical protein ACFFIY_04080 [Bhargavaea ullalensis]|uniref:Coat F domain-containing protein n=1 Tax=Bhargavaea ullalensis TaxID=1265685 RepID=A0ABV2GDL2_9BACL
MTGKEDPCSADKKQEDGQQPDEQKQSGQQQSCQCQQQGQEPQAQEKDPKQQQQKEKPADSDGGQNSGEFNDQEIARLLLVMEESLSLLLVRAQQGIFSSQYQSMIAGFLKDSEKNQRNMRDLMQRHGWLKPEPAKKCEFEQLLQTYKDSAPPTL